MQVFHYELDIDQKSIWKHVSATTSAKADFIYLQEVGYFQSRKKYYTTRQGLDSFLIKLTISGGGILEYGGQKQQVGPGQFFWIDCTGWQKYYTDPEIGHWDVIWVHFNGANSKAYYDTYKKLLGADVIIGKAASSSNMLTLLETILQRTPESEHSFLDEQNLFEFDVQTSGLLTSLIMECISSASNTGKSEHIPPLICDIRNYLTAHYTEKITLGNLAEKFNLDQFYLQKLFKKYIGQSPIEYIIYMRMIRAASLLRTGGMSISEIAYSVGIESLSHFSRQFKKQEGMTPSQYRKFWPSL